MPSDSTHDLTLEAGVLHGQFSSSLSPVLTIASGDTVRYHRLPDVAWGLEKHNAEGGPRHKVEPRTPPRDDGPCLAGPIRVEGAAPGDGHAAQGHGESSGTGIECMMEEAKLRYVVRPDLKLDAPRAETPRGWVAFGVVDTLDDASTMALRGMLRWLTEAYDLPRTEALALASVCVDLEVTQLVNGVQGVHAVLSTATRGGSSARRPSGGRGEGDR